MITAQVSVYPLGQADIGPAIDRAIAILQGSGLHVEVGSMSTLVAGQSDTVFAALRDAFSWLAAAGHVVMMVTVSNACPLPSSIQPS